MKANDADDPITERQRQRMQNRKVNKQFSQMMSEDNLMPGKASDDALKYPNLLRDDYPFEKEPVDANDIILQSNCQNIGGTV